MNRNYKIYNQVLNERIYAGASGYCLGFVVSREGIRAAAANFIKSIRKNQYVSYVSLYITLH